MQSRFRSGLRGLIRVATVGCLLLVPALGVLASTPFDKPVTRNSDPGSDATIRQPLLFPRSTYQWPFATGPVYGDVDINQWNRAGVLHTQVGSFDLTRGTPAFPQELRTQNRLGKVAAQYFVLQLDPAAYGNGAFDRLRDVIVGTGGAIVQDMPVAAHIARITQAGYQALQGQGAILALEPYHPAFKLNPLIGRSPLLDPVAALSDVYDLDVQLFPGESSLDVAKAIAGIGGNVKQVFGDVVRVDLNRAKLADLAGIEAVKSVFEHVPVLTQGQESSQTVQMGGSSSGGSFVGIPYSQAGILGDGNATTGPNILMDLDSGLQIDNGDLSNTRTDAYGSTFPSALTSTNRKVLLYTTTAAFGGGGDTLGCDSALSGGFTHGHVTAATALGDATNVPASYGAGWSLTDSGGNPWNFDGVAYGAKVLMYDSQTTPASGGCDDPGQGGLVVGNVYDRTNAGNCPSCGSLKDAWNKGARVSNFSWGATNAQTYGSNASKIDSFLFDNKDAMVFISAGNDGKDTNSDGIPDPNSVSDPATSKSAVVVGACLSFPSQQFRASFSSVGADVSNSTQCNPLGCRVMPLLMAPGADGGTYGLAAEYSCGSSDNDSNNPVECRIIQGLSGTSFSSPAAAGAALVVRDYFQKGFYPDATNTNPGNAGDQVNNVSGALVKAVLVASTVFLDRNSSPAVNGSVTLFYRFNREQGYGRVELDKALPLSTWTASPKGLIVADGGIPGGQNNTSLSGNATSGSTENYTLNVCDTNQELRIALAWVEDQGASLTNNLDLEVTSPAGRKYYGNYFTDDNNKNGVLDAGENCDYTASVPWPPPSTSAIDAGPWSLPTCANSTHDTQNPTEFVALSPDPAKNGILDDPTTTGVNEAADNQIELGNWTVTVKGATVTGSQPYAVAIAGPVCLGSSVSLYRVDSNGQLGTGSFVCNNKARVRVNELDEATDPASGLTTAEISSRTTVQVIDAGADGVFDTGDDVVVDQETNLAFTKDPAGLIFNAADLTLTDGTAQQFNNGALDVRSGQRVKVIYQDKTSGVPDPNKKRITSGLVNCQTQIKFGGIIWPTFGKDSFTLVSGGCEKDKRGLFTFGFPDKYMDAGELLGYRFAFQSDEDSDLTDVKVSLKAVVVDSDSPRDCKPNTPPGGLCVGGSNPGTACTPSGNQCTGGGTCPQGCPDPNRLDNPVSTDLTILDPNKTIGKLAAKSAISVNFAVQMNASISGTPEIEMVLAISAQKSGKGGTSYAVSRHRLDVDEVSFLYSTDFPVGGTEVRDWNNNETIESPTTDPKSFLDDYVFESRTFSDLTANGHNNAANLEIPWTFDTNEGSFRSGLTNNSTYAALSALNIVQWGEDHNFNNAPGSPVLPGESAEDRNGNGIIDENWNTKGGCGWQTKGANPAGGVWHTGTIDVTTLSTCLSQGTASGRCRKYQTIAGFLGNNVWMEILETPKFSKVNICDGVSDLGNCTRNGAPVTDDLTVPLQPNPVFNVEFSNWAWNQAIDLGDTDTLETWEINTDPPDKSTDFVNDFSVTNLLSGTQGAISGGNAPLADGFQLFSDKSTCVDTNGDGTPDHCGNASGVACTDDTACTGNNFTGTVGGNRVGADNCAFEGKTGGIVNAKKPYGLAKPADDDVRNGYCPRSDSLNGIDKSKSCVADIVCTNLGAPYTTPCTFDGTTTVDQFVLANGPIRNQDLEKENGPDMRFSTLEDIYGDSGQTFQGAVGFYTQEGTPSAQPNASFGLAIDDMVIEWREFKLDKDTTTCGAGAPQCADVELSTTNFYEGNSFVTITVTDPYPYDPVNNVNDCNGNGVYTDPGDTQDCNNNGIRDVVAKAISDAEPSGELVVLDEVSPGSNTFRGNLPISASFNAAGVLFVSQSGTNAPSVTVQYVDRNDGSGSVCKNDPDPARQGLVTASTSVFVAAGRVALISFRQTDNGDNDGWADTNETVNLWLTFRNKTLLDLDDLVVSINPADTATTQRIDCISSPTAKLPPLKAATPGSVNSASQAETLTPFVFHVSPTATRVGLNDDFKARFNVTIRSNKFSVLTRTVAFAIELDLDASGTQTTSGYREDFETKGSFGTFTSMTLDTGKASVTLSNGYRCQYNDPSGPNPNQAGRTTCYLGFTNATNNAYDWHWHSGASSDNGVTRAYTGGNSLHWGVHPSAGAKRDTERFSQLDAIRTTNPINLPSQSGIPAGQSLELSFKHEISIMDSRGTNTPVGETADRAVVAVQLADSGGLAVGNWNKIFAYENEYDVQGTDFFSNCTFDPIDDGNDEDSYFNPSDPLRRLGPSSTCKPEFTFGWGGDTDYRNAPGKLNLIGRAFDGPGLKGSVDRGTWVWPKFSLNEYKGRRIRVRFLATTIEVQPAVTYNDTNIGSDNNTNDDGWYIDDVRVDNAIASPVTLAVDSKTNSGLPGCTACSTVTAALVATPSSTGAPGQPTVLDAKNSTVDRCNNGVLQYQFWIDANANGIVGDAGDVLLRDWTDNSKFTDSPNVSTNYAVLVRCSSDPACSNTGTSTPGAVAPVSVTCPGAGNPVTIFFNGAIGFSNKTTISWPTSQGYDAVRGDLGLLRSSGFTPSVQACVKNDQTGTSFTDSTSPAAGSGLYWLLRPLPTFCNTSGSYSSGAPKEAAGRDAGINASANACP